MRIVTSLLFLCHSNEVKCQAAYSGASVVGMVEMNIKTLYETDDTLIQFLLIKVDSVNMSVNWSELCFCFKYNLRKSNNIFKSNLFQPKYLEFNEIYQNWVNAAVKITTS